MTANNCSLPNSINVSVFYAVGSTSPGALIIIVPMSDDDSLDYTNAVFRFLSRDMSEDNDNLVNATAGRSKVFAFDIEDNDGILRLPTTTAADTEIVTDVSGGESTYIKITSLIHSVCLIMVLVSNIIKITFCLFTH